MEWPGAPDGCLPARRERRPSLARAAREVAGVLPAAEAAAEARQSETQREGCDWLPRMARCFWRRRIVLRRTE